MTRPARARGGPGAALLDPVRDESRRLDPAVTSDLRTSLGGEFGDVVVHDGPASTALAEKQDAAAFTVGRHIVFNAGRYSPGSLKGRALLAHELTHVVQQRRGGGDLEAGFRMPASGLPVHSGRAESEAAGGHGGTSSGAAVGIARQTKAAEQTAPVPMVPMFEYKDESGTVRRVTLAEMEQLRAQAQKRMLRALADVESTATTWRETHREHLDMGHAESFGDLWDKPSRIWGVASNMRAGIVPPSLSMWSHPLRVVRDARTAIDGGNLAEGARLLRLATTHLNSSKQEWNTFIEATIEGAGKLAGELEVVRDTSFAIAIAAGAIVAAPLVAGAVAATGATGGTALALTAAGTGVTTAAGGALLRGSSDAAAQKLSNGKVDWKKTKKYMGDNVKQDLVTGFTAGLAPGAGHAAGIGKQGLSMSQNIARNVAVQSGVTATSELTGTAVETTAALADGKTWEQARDENLLPGLKQAAVNTAAAGLSAPLGPLGQKVAQSKPLLGKAVEHGGDALVTGGTVLATGGSLEDARNAVITSAVSGAAVRQGQKGSDKKAAAKQAKQQGADVEAPAPKPAAPDSPDATPAATTAPPKTPAAAAVEPPGPAAAPAKATQTSSPPEAAAASAPPAAQAAPQGKVAKTATGTDAAAPAPATAPVKDTGKKVAATEPPAAATPDRKRSLSDTERRAKAGVNKQRKEEARLEIAKKARAEAGEAIATAKKDVAQAQQAIDALQKQGKAPGRAEKRALATAQRDLAKAQTARSRAKAELKGSQNRLRGAKKDAAERTAAHREAKAAADAKQSGTQSKAGKRYDNKWGSLRKKAWKQWAAEELAARKAGTSKGPRSEAELAAAEAKLAAEQGAMGPDGQIPWDSNQRTHLPGADQDLNPLKAATDAELVEAARTGVMPSRLEAEIEHKRIPQRVGRWMAEAGVPVKDASALSKQGALDNLEPASKKWHSTLDESAARRRQGHDVNDPMSSLDQRTSRPLHDATNAEIADIVAALKKPGVDLDRTFNVEGQQQSWRDILAQEKARRPGSDWSVP